MILELASINSDATLNSFIFIGNHRFVPGDDIELLMIIVQPDKKIRYIPEAGSTIEVDLLKSDDTTLTKAATFPFADDRSIIKFTISAAESADLISQNLVVSITETAGLSRALLQSGLQLVNVTGEC